METVDCASEQTEEIGARRGKTGKQDRGVLPGFVSGEAAVEGGDGVVRPPLSFFRRRQSAEAFVARTPLRGIELSLHAAGNKGVQNIQIHADGGTREDRYGDQRRRLLEQIIPQGEARLSERRFRGFQLFDLRDGDRVETFLVLRPRGKPHQTEKNQSMDEDRHRGRYHHQEGALHTLNYKV